MLLLIIVKFFLFIGIQGEVIKSSCSNIGHSCSSNEDCCTKMCLYLTESSTATCVSKIENLSDYFVQSPEPLTSNIFNLKTRCHKNSDCNHLERCMLFVNKSHGVCMNLSSPKQKTPKQIAPEEKTTTFNPHELTSCVIPGLHCEKDDDCCSKKCYNYLNTGITYCRNTIDHSPASTINSYDQIITSTQNKMQALQCISTGLQCSRNIDCCSNNCGNLDGKGVQICLEKVYISTTTSLSVEIPKFCIKNRHICISDDDCCSNNCISPIFNSKMLFCEEYA